MLDKLSKFDKKKSGWILRTNSLNVALWEALVKDGFRTTHFIAEPSTLEGIKGVSLESGPPEAAANGEATDANANPEEVRIKSVINHAKSLGIPISAVPESAPDENVRRTILKKFVQVFEPRAINPVPSLPQDKPDDSGKKKKKKKKKKRKKKKKKQEAAPPAADLPDSFFGPYCPVIYHNSGMLVAGKHHHPKLKPNVKPPLFLNPNLNLTLTLPQPYP